MIKMIKSTAETMAREIGKNPLFTGLFFSTKIRPVLIQSSRKLLSSKSDFHRKGAKERKGIILYLAVRGRQIKRFLSF
jgi:hypothetical protein